MKNKTLKLVAPVSRWDEAIPLGNGLLGVLLWGEGNKIKLSLDRPDIWDLRIPEPYKNPDRNWQNLVELVKQGKTDDIRSIFENKPDSSVYPTKLPVGRVETTLDQTIQSFELDIETATAKVMTYSGVVKLFTDACKDVLYMRFEGIKPKFTIKPAAFGQKREISEGSHSAGDLSNLSYDCPEYGNDGEFSWTVQRCYDDYAYSIITGKFEYQDFTDIILTVTTSDDSADFVESGIRKIKEASEAGYEENLRQHTLWWENFWSKSSIDIPDDDVEFNYNLSQYFYGASSRYFPIALQGLWTADEGTLPPWRGDYHNDLNTELTYSAYLTANRLQAGECFFDFLCERIQKFKKIAKDFYGTDGICFPGVMSFDGEMMSGWAQYTYSPAHSAWLCSLFWLHWRYTKDCDFLKNKAYPICKGVSECLSSLLVEGVDGKLKFPISSSPEIYDNTSEAWLGDSSNYNIALLRALFESTIEMADALSLNDDKERWTSILSRLSPLACELENSGQTPLQLFKGQMLRESHRHHSHLMAIYPLGLLDMENSSEDEKKIRDTLESMDNLGMHEWVGYSFTWMSCLSARCGMGQRALNMLELFYKGFVSRNGFHLNGDYKNLGLAARKYRPFTLEANFNASQAVHEMLLQSSGGIIRVFPALPSSWEYASFYQLRAEGSFLISAEYEEHAVKKIAIYAEHDSVLRLKNPFGKSDVRWSEKPFDYDKEIYSVKMKKSQTIEACVI